jgi:arylsulfatase A-like enzyme
MSIKRRAFLKKTAIGALASICGFSIISNLWADTRAADSKNDKPNVIVIFTDDHGYADLGCQKSLADIKTPHIDKLAADGVRCTNGYITAPQCIPSRAGILSGRYQQRFGVDHNGTIPMPLGELLIPQRLRQAGYATGMVGKWHLDPNHQQEAWIRKNMPDADTKKRVSIPAAKRRPYLPDKRGFTDIFCGHIQSYLASYDLDGRSIEPAQNLTKKGFRLDIQTDASLAFIDRHTKEPFFLYTAYFAPHVPLEATEKYLKRFPGEMPVRRKTALAMIAAIDDGVGRIRQRLRHHAIEKDTLIFFISDNGAPLKIDMKDIPLTYKGGAWDGSRNDPWVGEKGMLSEGGIRVPYIVTWPGKIPAGKTYHHPVTSLDVGATAVALAGLAKVPSLDGVDLVPYLTGDKTGAPHEMLFWRFWNQTAVRMGRWKYLQAAGQRRFLFDLHSPEHEKKNRLEEHPEIAKRLKTSLEGWAEELENPGVPSGKLNSQEKKFYDHYFPVEFPAEKPGQDDATMSYLDNGQVRLSVDLTLGGSITYLADCKEKQNLINSHDWGREVQMSFYSGPVPFEPAAKKPSPHWAKLGWNPIQAGDYAGKRSRLLEHRNDGKTIYVKCIPMQWPLDNEPGECTFQCWLTLDKNTVQVRSRLNNQRTDKTQYNARSQELPAVYTNGPWHRLITYSGENPYTNAPITEIPIKKKGPGIFPWSRFQATENWAALVDKDGRGLGVWTPGVHTFLGGFAGPPGKGGPKDSPTGYITPIQREVLDHDIMYTYEYELIVGSVAEIRGHVYAKAKRETRPDYQFTDTRQHWTYHNARDTGWPIKGELHVKLEQNGAALNGPSGIWQAADAPVIYLTAAIRTGNETGRLQWRRFGEDRFQKTDHVEIKWLADGKYHTYELDLGKATGYRGSIAQLRLVTGHHGQPGDWIKVRSISYRK